MKYLVFSMFVLLFIGVTLGLAEVSDGTIPFDAPNMPSAKFQIHFTRALIAMVNADAPFDSVDNLYVGIYDYEDEVFEGVVRHYDEKLGTAQNWRSLYAEGRIRLWTLAATDEQGQPVDSKVIGIFGVVRSDVDIYLLNIVGGIEVEAVGYLLGNLGTLGVDIAELRSIPGMKGDARSLPSPTGFRTTEGFPIYNIWIKGNKGIESSEILDVLATGGEDIQQAVDALRKTMETELEEVVFDVKVENGKHYAVITVKEGAPSSSSGSTYFNPSVGFNRVSGWKLGVESGVGLARARFSSGVPTLDLSGYVGYGFGNRRVDSEIGMDVLPFATYARWNDPDSIANRWYQGFGIAAKYRSMTGTAPDVVVPEDLTDRAVSFYNFLGGTDLRNYYGRRGTEVALRWEQLPRVEGVPPKHKVRLAFLAEAHESLERSTDWHLFNWDSTPRVRVNPMITDAQVQSVMFTYDFNDRQGHLGSHHTFFLEYSAGGLGSDVDFTRYGVHLRYALPLGAHQFRTRAIGSFSDGPLPIQRQFVIGGPGVLNGYPLHAFVGDAGYLFNVAYFYSLPDSFIFRSMQFDFNFDLFLVVFFDAGQAWASVDEERSLAPKGNMGLGIQIGQPDTFLRVNVAQPFESEQDVQFNLVWFYSF